MRPSDETELVTMIRTADRPLSVRGGGTRGVISRGEPLSTAALAGVVLYEPGALTLVARAGTALADIKTALGAERQRLAFEPPDLRLLLGRSGDSTIGGIVAENASGPRRVQAGACRDSLLGVRFVTGAGEIVKNGGRVMKNVTGYDLVKLMAGSRGGLGVLTEVSLKVQAVPEAEATLVADGLDDANGVAVLRRALGSPFDVSGAARAKGSSLIRIEGMTGSVSYRSGRLKAMLGGDWRLVEGEASSALWVDIASVRPLAGRAGALWRIVTVPTEALAVPSALAAAGVPHEVVWDWGGGLIWLSCPEGKGQLIRAALLGKGHATRLRGAEDSPSSPPLSSEVAALQSGLKAKFDPRGVLNTGASA